MPRVRVAHKAYADSPAVGRYRSRDIATVSLCRKDPAGAAGERERVGADRLEPVRRLDLRNDCGVDEFDVAVDHALPRRWNNDRDGCAQRH